MKKRLIAASLAFVASIAQAYTLDFGNGPSLPEICSAGSDGSGLMTACADYGHISQGYGDVAGVVEVSYSDRNFLPTSLAWWSAGYNDLYGVLWAFGGDGSSHARVELKPLDGSTIKLTHFDLGAWPNTTRSTNVNVYEIGSTESLFDFTGSVGDGSTHTSFNMNLSSRNGLWIEWHDSAYNVGLDNIDFTLSAIPEPGTYALLMAGLGLLGFAARRKKMLRG